MAIQKEIWQAHIEGNLFKNNEILLQSVNSNRHVLMGKVVHIPQAGATPAITKNAVSFPQTVVQRTDTDVTYALDVYTSAPILIADADTIELSYNKRESVLAEHEASLRQAVAENILKSWAPTGTVVNNILRTSGDPIATHLDGTTGNRCRFTVADLKKADTLLNKQNMPMEGRVALLSADMFSQLTDDMSATFYRDFSNAYDATNGKLGRLFGFDIYMRGSTVTYDNSATPVCRDAMLASAPGGTAPDDNDAALFWQIGAVEHAVGEIKFFEKIGDPQYFGDIYSMLLRIGGRKRRADEKGVVAIVQSQPA